MTKKHELSKEEKIKKAKKLVEELKALELTDEEFSGICGGRRFRDLKPPMKWSS